MQSNNLSLAVKIGPRASIYRHRFERTCFRVAQSKLDGIGAASRRQFNGGRDIAIFHWEMLAAINGRIVAGGLAVLRVNDEGRILVDYLFVL